MHHALILALRLGGLAAFTVLLCVGFVGMAGRVQAAVPNYGNVWFLLDPENDEEPYACVGKPVKGDFFAGVEQDGSSDPDPLAPLVAPMMQVTTAAPKVGTLSERTWTVRSVGFMRLWRYMPTKPGDEELVFSASLVDDSNNKVTKSAQFPVINCQYKITITSEINNYQGGIHTYISYTAEGHFDVLRKSKNSPWTVKGYGVTSFLGKTDGTEGEVTCVTNKPGEGKGTFEVEGESEPNTYIDLRLHFSDTGSAVGPDCKKKDKTGVAPIRYYGWLPTGSAEGVLEDLRFPTEGGSEQLGIGNFNDRRWVQGHNDGLMIIEVEPVENK